MKSKACEKMWSMINVQVMQNAVTTCCQRSMDTLTVQGIKELGPRLFLDQLTSVRNDRDQFIQHDQLPDACAVCQETWPNSLWHTWNSWKDRDWTTQQLADLRHTDCVNLIEISLSNICNQTCMYCGPNNSSDWAKLTGTTISDQSQWRDQFILALYAYIEQHLNHRQGDITYNFLGGEPLLNTNIYDIMQGLISAHLTDQHPDRSKQMMITTNLNVKPALIHNLLAVIDSTDGWTWQIKCSIDARGSRGEIIRDGLDVALFQQNLELLLSHPRVSVEILPSISVLNVPELADLIAWILSIMLRLGLVEQYGTRWQFGTNIIHNPTAMHPGNLSVDYAACIDQCLAELSVLDGNGQLSAFVTHLENIRAMLGSKRSDTDRAEMRKWFTWQAQLRQLDYWQLFPVLADLCGPR